MKPNKSLGQHWLNDDEALAAVVHAGEVEPGDKVLEIGPGMGALTEHLLAAGVDLTAVEFDSELFKTLQISFSDADNLKLINDDILQFDLNQLASGYKVVANIPYYITAKILQKFMTCTNKPKQLALLVQKEVAERVTASPGQMSVLSFSVQYFADASLGEVVPASAFDPPPKVDSQILIIKTLSKPRFEADEAKLFRLVKAGFGERRKKLINSLAGGLGVDKPTIAEILKSTDIEATSRAQELAVSDWEKLYSHALTRNMI